MECRDLNTGRDPLPLERFPDNFLQIDDGLPCPKGQRLLVRGHFAGSDAIGAVQQQQDKGEENRREVAEPCEIAARHAGPIVVHSVSFPGKGTALHTRGDGIRRGRRLRQALYSCNSPPGNRFSRS